jgi:hypothetical protein
VPGVPRGAGAAGLVRVAAGGRPPDGPVSAEIPVSVGDVLELAEQDYRFGVGPLTLRVTALLHVLPLPDGPWLYLRGVPIRWDGRHDEPRQVLVRLAALRRDRGSDQGQASRD